MLEKPTTSMPIVMAPGIIIVTAQNVDAALINRLLLHLRDWEYRADTLDDADSFVVWHSKQDIVDYHNDDEQISRPPIRGFINNEWEGLSLEEVRKIMLQNDNGHGSLSLFLLLDDKGVEEQTIILAHRAGNDPAAPSFEYIDEFNKMRVPWEKAYITWVNLDIGKHGF